MSNRTAAPCAASGDSAACVAGAYYAAVAVVFAGEQDSGPFAPSAVEARVAARQKVMAPAADSAYVLSPDPHAAASLPFQSLHVVFSAPRVSDCAGHLHFARRRWRLYGAAVEREFLVVLAGTFCGSRL